MAACATNAYSTLYAYRHPVATLLLCSARQRPGMCGECICVCCTCAAGHGPRHSCVDRHRHLHLHRCCCLCVCLVLLVLLVQGYVHTVNLVHGRADPPHSALPLVLLGDGLNDCGGDVDERNETTPHDRYRLNITQTEEGSGGEGRHHQYFTRLCMHRNNIEVSTCSTSIVRRHVLRVSCVSALPVHLFQTC